MKVKVEACWGGSHPSGLYYSATEPLPPHRRVWVYADEWTRDVAKKMLDLLEMMGYNRRNIRWDWY